MDFEICKFPFICIFTKVPKMLNTEIVSTANLREILFLVLIFDSVRNVLTQDTAIQMSVVEMMTTVSQ